MDENFPPFVLPEIWNDDDVMYSYMQPIRRSKSIDPVNYNLKVNFWKSLLIAYVRDQHVFVLNKASTQNLFKKHFRDEGFDFVPQSIGEVYADLLEESQVKVYVPGGSLLNMVIQTAYNYLLQRPLLWSYSYLTGSTIDDQVYVFYQFAAESSNEFIQWFHKTFEHKRPITQLMIYLEKDFLNALESYYFHVPTRDYIYDYLKNISRCIKTEHLKFQKTSDYIKIVRIAENTHSEPAKSGGETEIAALSGIIKVKSTIDILETEMNKLSSVIKERRVQIKKMLVDKRVSEAKVLLKRTKVLEKSLDQKHIQLQNLEAVQLDIESASQNVSIVNTLSDANSALKQTLGPDMAGKAENVMNNMFDTIQDNEEVTNILTSSGRQLHSDVYDLDELQSELDDLMRSGNENDDRAVKDKTSRSVLSNQKDLERQLEELSMLDGNLPSIPQRRRAPGSLIPN